MNTGKTGTDLCQLSLGLKIPRVHQNSDILWFYIFEDLLVFHSLIGSFCAFVFQQKLEDTEGFSSIYL